MAERIIVIGKKKKKKKSRYPHVERKRSASTKSWHENRVFGEYANGTRIKTKTLWCSSLKPRI